MNRISNFLRGRQPKPEQKQQKSLPANFAQQVLNMQLQVQANPQVPIETINHLIELYSIAVQYYQSLQSSKYMVFKNKITKLLINPTVNRTMVDSCASYGVRENKPEQAVAIKSEERRRCIENNLTFALQNSEGDVKYMLIDVANRQENLRKMIMGRIYEQEEILQKRLGKRRKRRGVVGSRQPTEGDQEVGDKNKENRDGNVVVVEAGREKTKGVLVFEEEKRKETKVVEKVHKQVQQNNNKIEQQAKTKKQEQDSAYLKYLLTPEQVQMRREKISKKRSKKKVLTLKGNQSAELPSEFNVMF